MLRACPAWQAERLGICLGRAERAKRLRTTRVASTRPPAQGPTRSWLRPAGRIAVARPAGMLHSAVWEAQPHPPPFPAPTVNLAGLEPSQDLFT